MPLSGGAPRALWDFSSPKDAAGKRPSSWALPLAPLDPPWVAAHLGDKVYSRRAGGDWSIAVSDVPRLEHLAVEALRNNIVITWSDPSFGVRYQTLPR
jgi:hypothetical protein